MTKIIDIGGIVKSKREIIQQSTEPTNIAIGDLWIDTSVSPSVLKRYDGATWISISGGGGSTSTLTQTTKLGISASTSTPKQVLITIPSTTDFSLPPLEVLRFIPGTTNLISTKSSFSNAESTDFNTDSQVIFDGTMRLKNAYSQAMVDNGALGVGKLFSQTIDLTLYKIVEKTEVV